MARRKLIVGARGRGSRRYVSQTGDVQYVAQARRQYVERMLVQEGYVSQSVDRDRLVDVLVGMPWRMLVSTHAQMLMRGE